MDTKISQWLQKKKRVIPYYDEWFRFSNIHVYITYHTPRLHKDHSEQRENNPPGR